jgi:hypothetical protein
MARIRISVSFSPTISVEKLALTKRLNDKRAFECFQKARWIA